MENYYIIYRKFNSYSMKQEEEVKNKKLDDYIIFVIVCAVYAGIKVIIESEFYSSRLRINPSEQFFYDFIAIGIIGYLLALIPFSKSPIHNRMIKTTSIIGLLSLVGLYARLSN